jgi:phosphonoacetate hydrolase
MGQQSASSAQQRVIILMLDGLGTDYYAETAMPVLKRWAAHGIYAPVQAVMPTVTNANNVGICCGSWPESHGTVGNSWLDETTGREEYMESSALILQPTIFERAQRYGVRSALLTSKKKTVSLMSRGVEIAMAAEEPTPEWVERLGEAPPIYSREINYWLLRAAIDVLRRQPEIGLLFVHTTDYPMHTWPPGAPESQEHLRELDRLLGEAETAAPDAAFLVTADHGMNYKTRCIDLEKALSTRGAPIRIAISAERDKYLRHHKGYGGTAWVHLNAPEDERRIATALRAIDGVEQVMTRAEAAKTLHLKADRIGDLVVLGDKGTVFGHLEAEIEILPAGYRNHGSLYELDVPLVLHNAHAAPEADYFQHNFDLARWLYSV